MGLARIDPLLADSYASLAKAKRLIAIVQAAEPPVAIESLSAANRSRVERALLHCLDAVSSLKSTLETP